MKSQNFHERAKKSISRTVEGANDRSFRDVSLWKTSAMGGVSPRWGVHIFYRAVRKAIFVPTFLALHIGFVRFEDFGTNTFLYFFVSFLALGIIGKCNSAFSFPTEV